MWGSSRLSSFGGLQPSRRAPFRRRSPAPCLRTGPHGRAPRQCAVFQSFATSAKTASALSSAHVSSTQRAR
eukprot:12471669-Alexandrium_andersonii.AAC.1